MKKILIFLGSTLGPLAGMATVYLFGDPVVEAAILVWGFVVAFVISGLMIPLAFRQLEGISPLNAGRNFLLMLSPLVLTISHPIMSASAILLEVWHGYAVPWLVGITVNSVIFFCAGTAFAKLSKRKSGWASALLAALVIVAFYLVAQISLSQMIEV